MTILLPPAAVEVADVTLAAAIRTAERVAGEASWVAEWVDRAVELRGRVGRPLTDEDRLVLAAAAGINSVFQVVGR